MAFLGWLNQGGKAKCQPEPAVRPPRRRACAPTPLDLDEVTPALAAEVLGVAKVEGTALAVVDCRKLVRAYLERFGMLEATEKRSLLLRECRRIDGLVLRS
ncbi:MAG: hypothetical protein V1797_02735 [Pseudomonadota bacterium]